MRYYAEYFQTFSLAYTANVCYAARQWNL